MTPKVWILLLCSLVGYSLAEYWAKKWATAPRPLLAVAAACGYLVNVVFWLPALRQHQGLAVLSLIYGLAYCVVSVFIGVMLFQEPLSGRQELGIVLALIAIALMA